MIFNHEIHLEKSINPDAFIASALYNDDRQKPHYWHHLNSFWNLKVSEV